MADLESTINQSEKILVLLVDDETLRNLSKKLLEMKGDIMVETAPDGSKAIDLLKEKAYHVVVTDIDMPKLCGLGLYSEFKKQGYKSKFIMMSGIMSEDRREFLDNEKIPYLTKPFASSELHDLIKKEYSKY